MFIVLSSFTLYLFLLGYASASFLRAQGRLLDQAALTIAAGLLINYCLMLTGQAMPHVFAVGLVIALAGALRLLKDLTARRNRERFEDRSTLVRAVGVVALMVVYYFEIFSRPLRHWDARSIWFFHAKMIWVEGGLRQHAGWNDPSIAFSGPDYPKLVPTIAAQLAYLKGYWNEFLPKGSLLVILIPLLLWVFSFSRIRTSFVLLVLTFFLSLSFWFWNGYMDWYLAMYCGVALLSLGRYLSDKCATDLYSGMCALGIAANIKNEGLLFALCLLTVVAVISPAHPGLRLRELTKRVRKEPAFATLLLLSILPTLMWTICKNAWGLHSAYTRNPPEVLSRLSNRLFDGSSPQYVFTFLTMRAAALWMMLALIAAVAVFAVHQKAKLHRGALVAASTAVLYVCGLYVVYLSTHAGLNWQLGTSATRTMLTAWIALVVSLYFLLSGLEADADQPRLAKD